MIMRRFIDVGLAGDGLCEGCEPLQSGEPAKAAVFVCVGEPGTGRDRRFCLCDDCRKILATRLVLGEG